MNIGLLGGSFNPPHIGHILIAQQVLDFTQLDEVWLLPAYTHSFDKPLAPVKDRVAMTRLISSKNISVSTIEVDHRLDGQTIRLLPVLENEHKEHSFTFVMGSDQLTSFTKWGNWEDLLVKIPFLVVPRAGYELAPIQQGMRVLQNDMFVTTNVSSSMVRERIKKGLSIKHFVIEEVRRYIEKKMLYK